MKNLFFICTQDAMGEGMVEIYLSNEMLPEQPSGFCYREFTDNKENEYIGNLMESECDVMDEMHLDPSNEKDCIKFATEVKKITIPEFDKFYFTTL